MKITKRFIKWPIFVYMISVLILLYLKPNVFEIINEESILSILIVYIICVITHFLSSDNSNWFRLDVFFLLGFTIVHLQWPVMYAVSNILPDNYWRIFVNDKVINFTSWLSAMGGVFFLIGFKIFKIKKSRRVCKVIFSFDYKPLLLFTIFFFVLFLLFVGSGFLSGNIYKDGSSSVGAGISKYFSLFYEAGLVALTAIIIYQNKDNYKGNLFKWFLSLNKIYLVFVSIYILLFLAIGDRGGPIKIILTLLILIGSYVRKFNFLEFSSIAILGGVLMTIIGLGRSEVSGFDILKAGSDKYSSISSYGTTLELANSYRTLNTAVSHVPSVHDYFYGSLWMSNILAPVPFAQSLYLEATDLDVHELSTASYITYLVYGINPPSGEGTSLIADIYMNFGLFGVVVFMTLLGLFFKQLTIELKSPSNYKWLIAAAVFSGLSLYYSRSSYLLNLRDLVWGILFVKFLVKIRKKTT